MLMCGENGTPQNCLAEGRVSSPFLHLIWPVLPAKENVALKRSLQTANRSMRRGGGGGGGRSRKGNGEGWVNKGRWLTCHLSSL